MFLIILSISLINNVHALPPIDAGDLYKIHELILAGKIISRGDGPGPNHYYYDVKVEEYYKNQKSFSLLKFAGPKEVSPRSGYEIFEVGDDVLLYLNKVEGVYVTSPYSIKLESGCTARETLGLSIIPGEPLARGGPANEIEENPCFPYSRISNDQKISSISPLKQYRAGIPIEEIKCKEFLQLIQKKDGFPACVSYETAIKLDSRGWSFPIWTGGSGEEVFPSAISKIDSHKDCMNSDKKLVYEGTTHTIPYIVSIEWNPHDLKTSEFVNFEIQIFDVNSKPLQNVTYDFVWKTGPDSGTIDDRYIEDFGKIHFDALPIKTADPCYIAVSVHIDKIGEKLFKRDPLEIEKYGNMSPVSIQFHHYAMD